MMTLSKKEIQSIIVKFLEENPETQLASIRGSVEHVLRVKGEIGEKTEGNQYSRRTWVERISDKDALLINEVIYDLLYSRVITPGLNRDNLELPWVHVSNKEKLKELRRFL